MLKFTIRTTAWKTTLASLQWFFFIFANTVVVPISVGTAFGLSAAEIAGMMKSSLVFTGIACILQGWIGHKFPLMEGHSGIMWGLVLNLGLSASTLQIPLPEIGGSIAAGMLLAGLVTLIFGAFRLLGFLQRLFTPMVMSVYLFLLTFQLILIFSDGMLAFHEDGSPNGPISLFSVGVAVFVALLKIKGNETVGNFSILIGIVVGWLMFLVLFPAEQTVIENAHPGLFEFPLFPLGTWHWHPGIVGVTFLASIINLTNAIAAVRAASAMMDAPVDESRINRSYLLNGFYSIVGSLFGLVSYAPFSSSVGFLESTRILDRKPFLIGGGIMAVLGLIPTLSAILSGMPATVGNAVLFVAYLQLFGTSLKSLNGYGFDSVTIHRIAIPLMTGLAIFAMDPAIFAGLPPLLQPILGNGFIVGVLLSLLLEHTFKWDKLA